MLGECSINSSILRSSANIISGTNNIQFIALFDFFPAMSMILYTSTRGRIESLS
jgi:hypothetical protein